MSNHFPEVQDLSVCVVLPAYHAAKTLKATLERLPSGACQDIILVDDASTDDTIDVARELGIKVHRHPENRGYGGNQKTCYRLALETDADVIVMLHPDNQYDGALVPFMTGFIKAGVVDIVLGSRISRREEVLAGGMPPIKYIANRFLTIVENVVLGLNLPEYHTGYRAYHRRVLETINFEACSDDFVFDQQFLVQARVHRTAHRGRAGADALRPGVEQHSAGPKHQVRVRHAGCAGPIRAVPRRLEVAGVVSATATCVRSRSLRCSVEHHARAVRPGVREDVLFGILAILPSAIDRFQLDSLIPAARERAIDPFDRRPFGLGSRPCDAAARSSPV